MSKEITGTRGRFAGRFAPALLLALAAGCGGENAPPPAAWGGTIDTTAAGTVVVTNPATPLAPESGPWRLTEEIRIGSMMGEGPETLGRVGDLLADAEGRIYVLETQAQEIRVFDADGRFLHTIGHEGEGPGELKQAAAMGWGPGGELKVADMGNARISVFNRDGEFLTSQPQPGGFQMFPWPGAFEADGGVITPIPRMVDGEFQAALVRYDAFAQPVDTFPMPRYQGKENVFELASEGGGGIIASVPYSPALTWYVDPAGYFWIAPNTAEYRIHKVSFAGDTLLTIYKPHETFGVTSSEIDSATASMKWFTDQGGRVDRSKFPDHKPALSRLFVTEDGRLVVRPITGEFGSGWSAPATVLDVFDPSGRYVARLPLPPGMQATSPQPLFTEGFVYAVVEDDLEVPYVVRYRIDTRQVG